MAIKKETLDQLLAGRDPKALFNKNGLLDELKTALAERVLNAELADHLGKEAAEGRKNHRNGYSAKKMQLPTPLPRAANSESMARWTAVICSN